MIKLNFQGFTMLVAALLPGTASAQQAVRIAPAHLWANGFVSGGRIALAGDLDGDGKADMLSLSTSGDGRIEAARTSSVGKPRFPTVALDHFGSAAVAAAAGAFTDQGHADVVAVFASGEVRLASAYRPGSRKYSQDTVVATIPTARQPKAPVRALTADTDGDGRPDVILVDGAGQLTLLRNAGTAEGGARFDVVPVSGAIPPGSRMAAGRFDARRGSSLLWLDAAGVLYRAQLRSERTPRPALGASSRVCAAMPGDGLAVGRFAGGKTDDILVGRTLLVGGSPKRIVPQPELPLPEAAKGDAAWLAADFDGDGRDDLLRIRATAERFVGEDLLVHFARAGTALVVSFS